MRFKTNTKEKFHVITVQTPVFSADMAAEFHDSMVPFLQNDVKNIILNLKDLQSLDDTAAEMLVKTQQKFYEQNASFVICEMRKEVEQYMDSIGLLEVINHTPTESEASDIVKMEEIERELLDGI